MAEQANIPSLKSLDEAYLSNLRAGLEESLDTSIEVKLLLEKKLETLTIEDSKIILRSPPWRLATSYPLKSASLEDCGFLPDRIIHKVTQGIKLLSIRTKKKNPFRTHKPEDCKEETKSPYSELNETRTKHPESPWERKRSDLIKCLLIRELNTRFYMSVLTNEDRMLLNSMENFHPILLPNDINESKSTKNVHFQGTDLKSISESMKAFIHAETKRFLEDMDYAEEVFRVAGEIASDSPLPHAITEMNIYKELTHGLTSSFTPSASECGDNESQMSEEPPKERTIVQLHKRRGVEAQSKHLFASSFVLSPIFDSKQYKPNFDESLDDENQVKETTPKDRLSLLLKAIEETKEEVIRQESRSITEANTLKKEEDIANLESKTQDIKKQISEMTEEIQRLDKEQKNLELEKASKGDEYKRRSERAKEEFAIPLRRIYSYSLNDLKEFSPTISDSQSRRTKLEDLDRRINIFQSQEEAAKNEVKVAQEKERQARESRLRLEELRAEFLLEENENPKVKQVVEMENLVVCHSCREFLNKVIISYQTCAHRVCTDCATARQVPLTPNCPLCGAESQENYFLKHEYFMDKGFTPNNLRVRISKMKRTI